MQKKGDYSVDIVYNPQKYLEKGAIISGTTLVLNIILLFVSYVAGKNRKTSAK